MQNRLKIQQILASIGSRADQNETEDIAHDVHDWHQVRYFDTTQLETIETSMGKTLPLFAEALKRAFREEFSVECSKIGQTTSAQYKSDSMESHAFLAFESQEAPIIHGTLAVPMATTQDWVTRLLGGSSETDEAKTLSALELTLLSDIAVSLVEAFSSAHTQQVQARSALDLSKMCMPVEETDELCTMVFTYKEENAEEPTPQSFSIVMPCCQLSEILDGISEPVMPSEAQLSEALHGHVNDIPVQITAEFACTQLTLEQALGLAVGDVLLIEKDLEDPMTLRIENQPIFYGKPVQCEDHYAIAVTDRAES